MTQKDPAACSKGKALALARAAASLRVTDWVVTTLTGSWTANTTYTCYTRLVGDTLEIRAQVRLSGAPTAATLTLTLPNGAVWDTAKNLYSAGADGVPVVGRGSILDSGTGTLLNVFATLNTGGDGSSPVTINTMDMATGAVVPVNATSPITFANGDRVNLYIQVPIA